MVTQLPNAVNPALIGLRTIAESERFGAETGTTSADTHTLRASLSACANTTPPERDHGFLGGSTEETKETKDFVFGTGLPKCFG